MSTPRGADELVASQAIPETTVNQQVRHTEAGAGHFLVTDNDLTAPPGSCADGASYIIAATATGLWAGKENYVATALGTNATGGWTYHAPKEGYTAYIQDENVRHLCDGTNWALDTTGGSYTDENARDAIGAALVEGAGIDITVNDGGDTITIASTITQYTDEMARDALGTALTEGTGIDITVNDGGDTITIAVDATAVKPTESLIIAVGDETTAITTGTAKVTFRMPYAFTLTAVRASLTTASSSGTPTVDINEAGSTILSTKLTIDASETTSTTAATPAVISDASLADDAEMTIDIDTAGTGAKGLKVYLIGHRT